jgi:hypothetical protein
MWQDLVDWFPTLASLASAKPNVPGKPVLPLDGFNVWDSISQNKPSPRTQILHNIHICFIKQEMQFIKGRKKCNK